MKPALLIATFAAAITAVVLFVKISPSQPSRVVNAKTPAKAEPSAGSRKLSLWTNGTTLRGANIWSKRIDRSFDGDAFGPGVVGPPYQDADFRALAAAGANYVNVSFPGIFTEKPPYALDTDVALALDRVLDAIGRADMFAVISFRTGPGRNEAGFDTSEQRFAVHDVWRDKRAQAAWAEMWKAAALRYHGNPIVAGYHLMVEPNANAVFLHTDDAAGFYSRYEGSLYDWNPFAGNLAEVIREVDADTPILVGGMDYSSVDWLEKLSPPKVPGVVLNFHFYKPYEYTHQNGRRLTRSYPTAERNVATIERDLAPALKVRETTGLPLAVGECGVMRWAPGADRYLADVLDLFEKSGMNHAVWLWESSWPGISYDEFNFRRGPDRDRHTDVASSALFDVIRADWARNKVRPSTFRAGQS